MSIKKTKEEFIEKAIKVHGDTYDYSLIEYDNNLKKVKIICKKHGVFEQLPYSHLRSGCRKCYNESRNFTKDDFINRSRHIHGNRYDYSLVEYKNVKTKVKIICQKHGVFEQKAIGHLSGWGCRLCANENNTKNTKWFIEKAIKLHGNKYDYSMVDYINAVKKIKIICPVHGVFLQSPNLHLRSYGCIECRDRSRSSNNEKFIEKANIIHNFLYDYSLIEYKNAHTKINIICKEHGIFKTTPHNHLHGKGCPRCWKSRKEIFIEDFLKENKIKYVPQKRFKGCKYKRILPFDFYLPKIKTCIEYDGEQHFMNVTCWGGEKALKENKVRDDIKNEYCNKNNIRLIRIKYDQDIKEELTKLILM